MLLFLLIPGLGKNRCGKQEYAFVPRSLRTTGPKPRATIYRQAVRVKGDLMGGSTFGKVFRVSTWGESHGRAVGVVVEGVPAGLPLRTSDIQKELDRRRPGVSEVVSPRRERDLVEILSGVFKGKTLGTPISMLVRNLNVDSRPYERIRSKPRPGHADLTYWLKFGHVDYRGGGRASARETVGRVAAGAIAKKLITIKGVKILGHTLEAAGVSVERKISPVEIRRNAERNTMRCADLTVAKRMVEAVREAAAKGDTTGGVVEIIALNVPPGLGEPVFDKLDADIAKAMMSIGAVKAVEIGEGRRFAGMLGSEANDPISVRREKVVTLTNKAGGILGGISTGMPIIVRLTVKPPSSIAKPQRTVDLKRMEEVKLRLAGRFDPNLCPRVVPVAEAMLALTLADHMLRAGKINPDRV
jgi:chorismate synthase